MNRIFSFAMTSVMVLVLSGTKPAEAQMVSLVLQGNAGFGLLGGNENPAVNGGGSGGLLSPLTYDMSTNQLTIDIGWGSGNGFTDLTGNATAAHLHGPTLSSGIASFSENAGVLINLASLLNNSATSGGLNGTIAIAEANEAALLAGRLYFNVHTSANPGGEIRGNLVAVPEPAAGILATLGALALTTIRRRRA